MTKYYKVLNGTKAKDGGNFDYKDYLPKGNKPGKWTPKIDNISMCNKGYHLTKDYTQWLNNGTVIYECEGKGTKIFEENENKICFSQIRFIRIVETNNGEGNIGLWNSGNRNSGNWNSGNMNSGNMNSGNRNSGNMNSGNRNSGNWNSGNRNSGNWNSGNMNSGNWNSGNMNPGFLNTDEPRIRIFNKYTSKKNIDFPSYFYFGLCLWINVEYMTEDEKKEYWWYKTTGGYLRTTSYKEAWRRSFDKATKEEVQQTIKLPNFNYDLFEEITGITKQMIQKRLKE